MFPPITDDYSSPLPRRTPNTPMNQGGMGGMFGMPPQQPPVKEEDEDESPIWLMFKKRAEREMNQKMQQLTQQSPQDLYQEKIDDIRSSKGSLATALLSDLFGAMSGSSKFVPTQQRLQEQAMKEYALQTARMGQAASMERAQTMQDRLVQMQGQFEARQKQDQEREARRLALQQDRNRIAELSVVLRSQGKTLSPEQKAKINAEIEKLEKQTELLGQQIGDNTRQSYGSRYDAVEAVLRKQYEAAGVDIDEDKLKLETTAIVDEQLRKGKQTSIPRGLIPSTTTRITPQVVNTGTGFDVVNKLSSSEYRPNLGGGAGLGNLFGPSQYQNMSQQGGNALTSPLSQWGMTPQQPQPAQQPRQQPSPLGTPEAPVQKRKPQSVPGGGRSSGTFNERGWYVAQPLLDPETGERLQHFSGEEEKVLRYNAVMIPAVANVISRISDEFITGNIDNWAGIVRGHRWAQTARAKLGRRGTVADMSAPIIGRLSLAEQQIQKWRESIEAQQLYNWTGAASSVPEQERVKRFIDLDPSKDPEAFFTGAMATGVIMMMDHLKKTDHRRFANVDILKDLDRETERLLDDMYALKERTGKFADIDEETRKKYGDILSQAAKPGQILNRIMRNKGLPMIDFSKSFPRGS